MEIGQGYNSIEVFGDVDDGDGVVGRAGICVCIARVVMAGDNVC
jgi:hypothetical protein